MRQSDAYRAASPSYEGTGHVSWMPARRPSTPSRARSRSPRSSRACARVQERLERAARTSERILCVSHWGFLHFFLGASIFREDFAPAHLPALYRISHINTGITLFEHRRELPDRGHRFDGWALLTWNDQRAPLTTVAFPRTQGGYDRRGSFI